MHGKQGGNKGFPKTQRVFVPRGQNHEQTRNPTTTSKGPDSTPTLSNSLRQSSLSKQSDAGASAIRVRKGENADWVSNRAPGGSFVNYLPQDEAVAAGLGADEGGLDPVESQRVVDLLNRELSRLLKLKPREFWRQGDFLYIYAYACFHTCSLPHKNTLLKCHWIIIGLFDWIFN